MSVTPVVNKEIVKMTAWAIRHKETGRWLGANGYMNDKDQPKVYWRRNSPRIKYGSDKLEWVRLNISAVVDAQEVE